MPSYNMQDYVSVAERVNEAQPALRSIHADPPVMLSDVMGYIRVTIVLKDDRSATGIASFRLDLTGGRAQATNPLEDSETSAIGRALAFLGYSSSKSIASREEVQEAQRREGASYQQGRPAPAQAARPAANGSPVARAIDLFNTIREAQIQYKSPGKFKDMQPAVLQAEIEKMERLIADTVE